MQTNKKVLSYETFLNERLRTDLKNILEQREIIYGEISEYLQLKSMIERLQDLDPKDEQLKTQVDLGCNFYVQAKVHKTSSIFVCVGYGFFVDFTFQQALKFIDQKTQLLNEKADILTKQAAKVKANIKLVLETLRNIQNIDDELPKPQIDIFA
ncbi:protein UXT homolog [Octopus vulgaris]|uniref:Protein UXT homolog n=2 Tax=Octopus TaxID=6643 RepID=A0AA36ATI2_OCTVU|nr:protein UXT [Octopus sinensis]CAI9722041.1 protein UXT homolog [Octopus vulgaris]